MLMPLELFGVSASGNVLHAYVLKVVGSLCAFASLVCVFFLMIGGYQYMTSSGSPGNVEHAKKLIRNALIGLVLVLSAAVLVVLLNHAYGAVGSGGQNSMPPLGVIKPVSSSNPLTEVITDAVSGLLQTIVSSVSAPFMNAMHYFTSGTPLMAANAGVFHLWLIVVGMADALFVLVIVLLGFHLMSFASFGLEEIEFKHLLPQIALIFVLFNSSIFVIDGVIELSNVMIHALTAAMPTISIWQVLGDMTKQSVGMGIAALLITIAFLIFVVILLIYYIMRLVTLYLGAVLSPLLCILWLLPDFRDFVEAAVKVYIATIFVLFIHVVILQLAASLLSGSMSTTEPIMPLLVGTATLITLLKTQGVLMQLSYVSVGPRTARRMGGLLANGISAVIGRREGDDSKSSDWSQSNSAYGVSNQQGGEVASFQSHIRRTPATIRGSVSVGDTEHAQHRPAMPRARRADAPTGKKVKENE